MRTKHDIFYKYGMCGTHTARIPKGTTVVPVDNLPPDTEAGIHVWVCPWRGMSEAEKSHMLTYGFGLNRDSIEK